MGDHAGGITLLGEHGTWKNSKTDIEPVIQLYSNVTFALDLVFDVSITSVLSFYLHQDRSKALKESVVCIMFRRAL